MIGVREAGGVGEAEGEGDFGRDARVLPDMGLDGMGVELGGDTDIMEEKSDVTPLGATTGDASAIDPLSVPVPCLFTAELFEGRFLVGAERD